MVKTLDNINHIIKDTDGLFQKFIISLIWFFFGVYIGILTALLFLIPAYLCQDLTVGSKQIILTEIVILFSKDFQAWIEYGQEPSHNIEHGFAYLVKLGIYTKLQLNMNLFLCLWTFSSTIM